MDNKMSYIEQQGTKIVHQLDTVAWDSILYIGLGIVGVITATLIIGNTIIHAKTYWQRVQWFFVALLIVISSVFNIVHQKQVNAEVYRESDKFVAQVLKPYLRELPSIKVPVEYVGVEEVDNGRFGKSIGEQVVIYLSDTKMHVKAVWGVNPDFSTDVKRVLKHGAAPYMIAKVAPKSKVLEHYDVKEGLFNPEIYVPADYMIKRYEPNKNTNT